MYKHLAQVNRSGSNRASLPKNEEYARFRDQSLVSNVHFEDFRPQSQRNVDTKERIPFAINKRAIDDRAAPDHHGTQSPSLE